MFLLALVCAVAAGAEEAPARFVETTDGVILGPAPEAGQIAGWHAGGLELIIDLRTPAEGVVDEALQAATLGVRYVQLPVGSEAASPQVMARVAQLLASASGRVLLHCGSGNRAGEVWARHLQVQGMDREAAVAAGREVGLRDNREAFVP